MYRWRMDEITSRDDNPSITRDVSGEGVQQALLKMIEGAVASIHTEGKQNKHPQSRSSSRSTPRISSSELTEGHSISLDKIISAEAQQTDHRV